MNSKKRGANIKNTVRKATETDPRPNPPKAGGERLTAYHLPNDQMERFLVTGEYSGLIEDYFGPEDYREIRELVQKAKRRGGGPRVYILPGMMGSKLGKRRPFPIPDDVVWFDPVDIAAGKMFDLALDSGERLDPLGVILLYYLKLKLRLEIAGFDTMFCPFDWRLGLDRLGATVAAQIEKDKAQQVHLVAHSMGGLVARAAFNRVKGKVGRLVMLGTPNFGSFVPVQCIRGVYDMVKKVAFLDVNHSPKDIAGEVLNTFPGLYQMLPSPKKFNAVDLFDPAHWPKGGPQPVHELLAQVVAAQEGLAPAPHEGFYLIAGVNRETVTSLKRDNDQFRYEVTFEGDGTVPLALAELPDTPTYYIEESHGSLPNNRSVARAVADILATGKTQELPTSWAPSTRRTARPVADEELSRIVPFEGRRDRNLSRREMRQLLDGFLSAESRDAWRPEAGETKATAVAGEPSPPIQSVVVGRRRQHRIEIRLALGDIGGVDAQAIVLGLFRDVAPTGPAKALDAQLDGAISEFTARRMFSGNVGEVFMLPTTRHTLRSDVILFVGLGPFDRYSEDIQQIAAENVIRSLIQGRIDELATVLLGAGSGEGISSALTNLIAGFLKGLRDADRDRRFRRITLCELDRDRFGAMRQELFRLAGTPLFDDVEVTFDEITLRAPAPAGPSRGALRGADPVYLIVRQEGDPLGIQNYRSSLLGAGRKATVVTSSQALEKSVLDRHLKQIESAAFTTDTLATFGRALADLVLTPDLQTVLTSMRDRHLVVVHDAASSRIPWETISIEASDHLWSPAKEGGISRRYIAENLSVAKWLEERRQDTLLNLLLVVNPTLDLDGAEKEGRRIAEIFKGNPAVKMDELKGTDATKGAVMRAFQSGKYDVIHYAGHAFFDPNAPANSGILCHGKHILSGREIADIGSLPALVFFNACEAGRIRKGPELKKPELAIQRRIERNVGLAEAFLRGGVANYVGTYWPVGDASAKDFAETFYTDLIKGQTIGNALNTARQAIADTSVDWADYIHYGDFNFTLKQV
jgi:pimeloyl-ACP methyl ester carboxylesterase